MTSQFKSPLPGQNQPASQKNGLLAGSPSSAAPSDQSQGTLIGQTPPQSGMGLLSSLRQPSTQSLELQEPLETPRPIGLADRPTLKQSSVSGPDTPPGPMWLPQTPGTYVQGQYGNYGNVPTGQLPLYPSTPGQFNTPQVPPGTSSAQMLPPVQHPVPPSSMFSGPLPPTLAPNSLGQLEPSSSAIGASPLSQLNQATSALGYNALNPRNLGASFSMPGMGMMPSRTDPGALNPERSTSPLSDRPMGSGDRKGGRSLPPGKSSGGKKQRKKRRFPIWARVLVGFLLLLVILGGTGLVYYQMNFAGAINSITGQQVQRSAGEEDPNANLSGDILRGPRINILLLGSDTDQKFQGAYIAQTDIVITIDPATKSVGMLSIPRDFYINVPGYGMHKLDEAYGLGGVDLSRLTIEQDFGIPINYYAWVGLDGFIKVINEVNGVDVDVFHPIVDDQYPDDVGHSANDPYALKRLYIPPGPQHLDGQAALEYVRSRHADLVGDFGRSARQQQVLGALKIKLANPNIFSKLSAIANDLKGYLKTDMQLPDILKLMNFARSLDVNKISKLILGPPYSQSGTLPGGESVVYPLCDQIVPAIAKMLQLGDNAACNIQANSGNSAPVALTSQPTRSSLPPWSIDLSGAQSLNSSVSNGVASLTGGSNDLFGIHSLLDLLLLGVFESPDVFQL